MAPGHDHYDQQTYAGDEAAQVKRATNHMPADDRPPQTQDQLQGQYGQEQANALAPRVDMDDQPGIAQVPNWNSYDQDTLVAMATQENDPSGADAFGQQFTSHGNELATAANQLLAALDTLDANWEGDAASAARGSIQPLADHAGKMGISAQLMGASLSQQSSAAQEAQRIPPAVNFDKTAFLNKALGDDPTAAQQNLANTDAAKLQGEADANKAAQVQVMQDYTKAMQAADKMPLFVPPPKTISGKTGGGSVRVDDGVHVKSRGTHGVPEPVQTTAPTPMSGSPSADDPEHPNDDKDNPDIPTIGTPLSATSTSGYTGPTQTVSTAPTLGSGPIGGAPHTATPSAGSGGFGGSFGNFSGSGSGGSGGPGGPGGPNATGTAEGGAGPRGSGPGVRGGMPAEEAFGRGGRASTGMGGGGRIGAEDDEDDAHARPSYLVEPDPNAVFDTDQATIPPVIGGE